MGNQIQNWIGEVPRPSLSDLTHDLYRHILATSVGSCFSPVQIVPVGVTLTCSRAPI